MLSNAMGDHLFHINAKLAFVEVGDEAAISALGQLHGLGLDVLGHAPPLLQDDDRRCGLVADLVAWDVIGFAECNLLHFVRVSFVGAVQKGGSYCPTGSY